MRHRRTIYLLTLLAAAMSLGHHIDHAIRGNAVGWPLTPEVNAFTISLGIYPVLLTALLLYRAGRVGASPRTEGSRRTARGSVRGAP